MDVQYQTRRQGETEGVSAYTSDMEALLSYSGLNQKGRVNYYISGLRPDIASLIRPKDPDTLQEAESLAREIERNLVAYSGSRRANEQDLLQTIREVTVASISEALGQYRHQADDEICALTPPTGPPPPTSIGPSSISEWPRLPSEVSARSVQRRVAVATPARTCSMATWWSWCAAWSVPTPRQRTARQQRQLPRQGAVS